MIQFIYEKSILVAERISNNQTSSNFYQIFNGIEAISGIYGKDAVKTQEKSSYRSGIISRIADCAWCRL